MRLITYRSPEGPRVAGLREDGVVDLNHADPAIPSCVKAFLRRGPEGLEQAAAALAQGAALPLEAAELLPPIPSPEKIVGIGLNYADHARETGKEPPTEPVVFAKFPTAVLASDRPIVLPRLSAEVDFEAELVVVIGRPGRHIPAHRALEHVAAYSCGCDVSARDWQMRKPGGQWVLGKSFDTFAPVGPALVTPDEVGELGDLRIQLRLNGQTMQDSTTAELIFPIEELVAYLSSVCTLSPGDLIYTGTPPGVGVARRPPVFLKPGDEIEVEIERIGVLRNPVIAEDPAV